MEKPDTDPPEVEWSIEEYSSKDDNGKLRWMLDKGLTVGKKILVTGVVISSAPIVLPPLAVISIIGFACSVPYALFLASYACTNKLMSKLLLEPEPPMYLLEYGTVSSSIDEGGEDDGNGYFGRDKEEEEMCEDMRKSVEMRIELAENDESDHAYWEEGFRNHKQELVSDNEIAEENGYEEKIELKIGGLGEEEEKRPVLDEVKTFVVDIKRDETSVGAVEGTGTTFKVTNVVLDFVQDSDIEEDEEIVRETTGLFEKIREEGVAENGEENDRSVEKGSGGAEEGNLRVDSRREVMRMPFETRNYYANVERESPLREIEREIDENEDDETTAESGEMPQTVYMQNVDVIPKEMKPKQVIGDSLATKESEVLDSEMPTGEMSGSRNFGFAENMDVDPEEMKPKPVLGDLADTKESDKVLEAEKPTGEMKETDEVLKAEKPTGEMSGTTDIEFAENVDAVPEEIKPKAGVGDLTATKESDEALEAEKPTGEMTGSRDFGSVENVDVVLDVMKPKPDEGDLAAITESDKVLEAEKPTGEMSGSRNLGIVENVDVVPEEMKPKPEVGDLAATNETDEVLKAQKPTVEMKETDEVSKAEKPTGEVSGATNFEFAENVDVVPEGMKPKAVVGDLAAAKESDEILEAEKLTSEISGTADVGGVKVEEQKPVVREHKASQQEGKANGNITKDAQQDSQLSMKKEIVISTNADAREIADESGFDLIDTNNVAAKQYSDADFNTVRGDCDRNDTGISSEENISMDSSKQVYLTEEKILEKIEAMRVIVGYKAARQATCLEELKALYLFTGVEPPASFKDPSDLMEVNDKLRFLMSIIGVK